MGRFDLHLAAASRGAGRTPREDASQTPFRGPAPGRPTLRVIRPSTLVSRLKAARSGADIDARWEALAARARGVSLSQTPAYTRLGLERALARGEQAFIAAVEADGRLVGAWALSARREGLLRVLRPVSCGTFEEYDAPLVDAAVAAEATAAVLQACLTAPADLFVVSAVARGSPLDQAIRATGAAEPSGTIEGLSARTGQYATWGDYLAASSAKHAKAVRYNTRKLAEEGRVEIGWCKTPDHARAVLDWAWRNKRAWARARRIDTPFLRQDEAPAFFAALAERLDLATNPLVSYVLLDGQPIAAQINLVGDRAFELFFTTYDERHQRRSPGEILIQESLRWAVERGLDFDFRVLAAPYKAWRSDTVTTYLKHDLPLSAAGRIVAPLERRSRRISRRLRRAPGKAWEVVGRLAPKVRRRGLTIISDVAQRIEDGRLGIDTHVPIPREKPDEALAHTRYEPVRYDALRLILAHLDLSQDDVVYDVGCGLGRVMCVFARRAVRQVVGVELDPALARAARKNVAACRGARAQVRVIEGDATAQDYDEASVVFLYHPFYEPVMGRFLRRLKASLERRPRPLTIVYCNPVCRDSMANAFGAPAEVFDAPYGGYRVPVAIWRLGAAGARPRRQGRSRRSAGPSWPARA